MTELLADERKPKETSKAVQACNDYLRMGPGRSLQKLLNYYQNTPELPPPVATLKTVKKWNKSFSWQARAALYDTETERQKNEIAAERRREAIETGLALDYERVLKLKHLALTLGNEIWAEDGTFIKDAIWLPDVKQIGSGEYAERVDIVRFNQAILTEFRAILDDLAKETGGRKQKIDVTWRDKVPSGFNPDDVKSQFVELLRLAALHKND